MKADDVDRHVGRRVRELREALGMTQMQLARAVGVSAQQTSKREAGSDRFSVGQLWLTARALGTTPEELFQGLDGETPDPVDLGDRRRVLNFVRTCRTIRDKDRRALTEVVQALAETE